MGKLKNNQMNSEALLKKIFLKTVKKSNPFEIQTTRSKFTILNRDKRINRCTGMPGVQRTRAMEKRKQTLGQEYLLKHKTNRFVDQRKHNQIINSPQHNNNPVVRQSVSSRRKELYNLNDSIKLTHKGQTLEEIERFDDAIDNESDSDDGGLLNDEFVKAVHFGGGEDGKDRKTVIEEMIAESKRRKAEKQRENDEIYEMTKKLDQNWQSLMSVVGSHMKHNNERPKLEDYDIVMREMIFERRGKPADRLKSEEELVRIEKQRMEKLERERLARMRGEDAGSKSKHRSADDLDDGYLLLHQVNELEGEQERTIKYTSEVVEHGDYNPRDTSKEESDKAEGSDSEVSKYDSSEENDSDSEEDNLSDLKDCSEIEEENIKEVVKSNHNMEKLNKLNLITTEKKLTRNNIRIDAELSYTFELPTKYEQLSQLLTNYSPDEQALILERMQKSYSTRTSQAGKDQLISLFAFVMQYINDLFIPDCHLYDIAKSFQIVEILTPYLHDLAQCNPTETSKCFLEVLKEKHEEFRKQPRQYPPLDTLIFLKLVPVIFSASDFRHPVVSPFLVFASGLLSRCQIRTRKDVTAGLFIVTTVLECVEQTNRFLPASLNFLTGVIYMCSRKRPVQVTSVVPPFKSSAPWNNLLAFEKTVNDETKVDFKLHAEDFITVHIDEAFKLRALHSALGLVTVVCQQLIDSPGAHYICDNVLPNLTLLDEDLLPLPLKIMLKEVLNVVRLLRSRPLQYLTEAEKKTAALRLLEPKIEPIYDDIRRRPKNPLTAREQQKKLKQKVKQESRAAAREIRQDNEFIAKIQFKQRAANDRARRDKVKRIFSDATLQQGELKSFDRKAKYKK
ncbi:nucleolar protein 14 homolog [Topomyia yanbarensis]|uniref:nucleolar protein 14 homolog n=1 Tax=Topomyia yanbarensis TaxID=2498891 RepID=UPI00273C340E|nr:nucleolar protein 14 homolog [Topomyia yanbarensis]